MKLPRVYPVVDSVEWVGTAAAAGRAARTAPDKGTVPPRSCAVMSAKRRRFARAPAPSWSSTTTGCWPWPRAATSYTWDRATWETADVPALRKAGVKIGISTHDHVELARALALAPDYIALGPIYPTKLKVMPFAPQGAGAHHRVETPHRKYPARGDRWPHGRTASGGVYRRRDVAAVVNDIVSNPDPDSRTREWLAIASRDA